MVKNCKLGGDCWVVGSRFLEGCIYNSIKGTVNDAKLRECSNDYFLSHVSATSKHMFLRNKYVCLKVSYLN